MNQKNIFRLIYAIISLGMLFCWVSKIIVQNNYTFFSNFGMLTRIIEYIGRHAWVIVIVTTLWIGAFLGWFFLSYKSTIQLQNKGSDK